MEPEVKEAACAKSQRREWIWSIQGICRYSLWLEYEMSRGRGMREKLKKIGWGQIIRGFTSWIVESVWCPGGDGELLKGLPRRRVCFCCVIRLQEGYRDLCERWQWSELWWCQWGWGETESEDALISGVLSLDSSVLSGPLSCEI